MHVGINPWHIYQSGLSSVTLQKCFLFIFFKKIKIYEINLWILFSIVCGIGHPHLIWASTPTHISRHASQMILHLGDALPYIWNVFMFSWQAVMKSFSVNGTDPTKQEKFLAYMAPAPHEVWLGFGYILYSKRYALPDSDGDYCGFISLLETWMMKMISSILG